MTAYAGKAGSVAIPSVGAGDITLSFDKNNPAERIRAARIVKQMLRSGFAMLVEIERDGVKQFVRAHDFDEDACCYVIADYDPDAAVANEPNGDPDAEVGQTQSQAIACPAPPRTRGKPVKNRVDAETTRAVSVARTAGG